MKTLFLMTFNYKKKFSNQFSRGIKTFGTFNGALVPKRKSTYITLDSF